MLFSGHNNDQAYSVFGGVAPVYFGRLNVVIFRTIFLQFAVIFSTTALGTRIIRGEARRATKGDIW